MSDTNLETKWQNATIQNNFVFGKTLEMNPDLCLQLLQFILNLKINKIEYPEREKVIEVRTDSKGIRLDVFVSDDQNRSFDVEMQIADSDNISKRMRYYQALIDLDKLKHGEHYSALGDSFIIFICPFDRFKQGRHIYTFRERCEQDLNLSLKDGSTKIFLSTKGTLNDVSDDIKNFLNYVDSGIINGNFVKQLDDAVKVVKSNEKARLEFMTYQMALLESENRGFERGISQGISKGIGQGIESVALNMLAKGLSWEEICDLTNLSLERIKELAKNNLDG